MRDRQRTARAHRCPLLETVAQQPGQLGAPAVSPCVQRVSTGKVNVEPSVAVTCPSVTIRSARRTTASGS